MSYNKVKHIRVSDVAHLVNDRDVDFPPRERLRHVGPYPIFNENGTFEYVDDYSFEAGGVIMLPEAGQLMTVEGNLAASLMEERCSAVQKTHVLVANNPADTRYLWRALTTSCPARQYIEGSRMLYMIGDRSLLAIPIPWPAREVRDAYVAGLDELERKAAEAQRTVPALLAQGDRAFAQMVLGLGEDAGLEDVDACTKTRLGDVSAWPTGTMVLAEDRAEDKPYPVEGALSSDLGRCDEALTSGPALIVGKIGGGLVVRYLATPAHPLSSTRYVDQSGSKVPLPVLVFAMRVAGMVDRNGAFAPARFHKTAAAKVALESMEDAMIPLGDPAAWDAFVPVAQEILDRVEATWPVYRAAIEDRAALVTNYFDTYKDVIDDELPPAPEAPVASCDTRVCAFQNPALGPLAKVLADAAPEGGYGMSDEDLAWELAPLAVIRACATPQEWAPVLEVAMAPNVDRDALVGVLDSTMDALSQEYDLLSFLPNLSYGSSMLAPAQLAAWVRLLDAVDPEAVDATVVRAAFELGSCRPVLPAVVSDLLTSTISSVVRNCLPQGFEAGFMMRDGAECLTDSMNTLLPQVTWRVQYDSFEDMLKAAMVRAVAMRHMRETCGGLGASANFALLLDDNPDWRAQLVVGAFPGVDKQWTDGRVPPQDPRWVLGVPPRTHGSYAWLQHALYHQEQGGMTVLLSDNTILGSVYANEKTLREKLAASGRVRMVAALPPRIWNDVCVPMSIVVMGDPRADQAAGQAADQAADKAAGQAADPQCLMIDATGLGVASCYNAADRDAATADGRVLPERVLTDEVAQRIAAACETWFATGTCETVPGFARAVGLSEIAAHEGSLGPWTYVK